MAATATEYAITKVGMSSILDKRGKPLRTYGRRNQATTSTDNEPPAKRQRSSPIKSPNEDAATVGTQRAVANTPTKAIEPEQAKVGPPKQSILSYFKKVEAPLVKEIEIPAISDKEEHSDDDSSPTRRQPARRKPRVLRLKPNASNDDNEDVQKSASSSPASTKLSPSPDKENYQSAAAAKRKRNAAAPSVQTTLNISSQAAFSECKVCDCLYNPLFPDDVKYHQKRHASVLRKKKKQEALEL